jgi:hypothetical protein
MSFRVGFDPRSRTFGKNLEVTRYNPYAKPDEVYATRHAAYGKPDELYATRHGAYVTVSGT